MSLAKTLRSVLPVDGRRATPGYRAALDLDAGDLLTPAAYPYAPGLRPVRPFVARVVDPGQGERKRGQLYPITGNPTQRTRAHVDVPARTLERRAIGDVSGNRHPAKITRRRPYLFAGGSSATTADKLAAKVGAAPAAAAAGPCEGCG